MKRILLIIMQLYISIGVAIAQGQGCHIKGGNHNPPPPPPHPQEPVDGISTTGAVSVDPNEIIGPVGYDDSIRWVSINDVLNYTILFENDPEFATANAQKVNVYFSFEERAWMKDFSLGTYGFANQSWNIKESQSAYQNRLDLRDSMLIYVDLTAGLDVVKQQAFWQFSSIDPETGINPWQVDRGMLPVNDSTHIGEGFVTFQLRPYEGLKTGDTISIVASIVFDQNDTIPTNRWRNTIDAGNPVSKVNVKQDSKNEQLHHITITGEDDKGGSGLKQVVLYQANNFGIYEEYAICPNDTVIDFMAEPGNQYQFYALAEDNVGNREPLKDSPDFVINLNAAPTNIAISDSIFKDDIEAGGFIAELSSEDIETKNGFVYALAEGEGAIHNDLFQVNGSQLQAKAPFKCAEDSVFHVRISTTDEGGLSYAKAFTLTLHHVLIKPEPDTLNVLLCSGETYSFFGKEYDKTGVYRYTKNNDYMCDSLYVLNLSILPHPEKPMVTVEGTQTLVSSAAHGNQWYNGDGSPVKGATGQQFTPTEDGIYYVVHSNGACDSEPSQAYMVRVNDHIDLTLDLKDGWNWISSNLTEADHQNARQFLNPIVDDIEQLVGDGKELSKDENLELKGNLTAILPSESYHLLVNKNTTHTWSGDGSSPEATVIRLNKGWNWIGYVPIGDHTLNAALAQLQPSENDVVKGLDAFAIYTGGHWTGTLAKMRPGEGYLYLSNNTSQFNYPTARVFPVESQANSSSGSTPVSPWYYDTHQYPDNVTLVGKVMANDVEVLEGAMSIGAFVNNECRGIGRYVDGLLYLTIHGTLANKGMVSFRAYEVATEKELMVSETVTFNGQHEGTQANPFILHVTDVEGIEDVTTANYVVYPRPLHDRMYIQGDTGHIKTVKVITTDGATVIQTNGYDDEGIDVNSLKPGVYVVAIITENGKVYYEKVMKVIN